MNDEASRSADPGYSPLLMELILIFRVPSSTSFSCLICVCQPDRHVAWFLSLDICNVSKMDSAHNTWYKIAKHRHSKSGYYYNRCDKSDSPTIVLSRCRLMLASQSESISVYGRPFIWGFGSAEDDDSFFPLHHIFYWLLHFQIRRAIASFPHFLSA